MAFSFYDSTGDTTTTVGSGVLVGTQTPPVGYQSPTAAGVVNGIQTVIRIENSFGDAWEVCESTVTISSGVVTYSRGAVIASSSGGGHVSFGPGIKTILYTIDAGHIGGAVSTVVGEKPIGVINGSNSIFTTSFDFVPLSVAVMVNGIMLSMPEEFYTTGNDTIHLSTSPVVGDIILVNYTQLSTNI